MHGLKWSASKVNYSIVVRVVPEASVRFSLLVTSRYCSAKVAVSHAGSHSVGSSLAQGFEMLLFEMKGKMLLT